MSESTAEAIETAARDLPEFWYVEISIEQGAAFVTSVGPHGISISHDYGETVAENILDAVAFAKCNSGGG